MDSPRGRPKRERFAALTGAILLTFILPVAFDQGYFRYNPYLLPVAGLIAVILYLGFALTSDFCISRLKALSVQYPRISPIGFIITGAIVITFLGIGEWEAIQKSKAHVNTLRNEDERRDKEKKDANPSQSAPQVQTSPPVINKDTAKSIPPLELTKKKEVVQKKPPTLSDSAQPSHAYSFLQVRLPAITAGTVSAGKEIKFNVYWDNSSPGRVFDYFVLAKLYVVPKTTNSSDAVVMDQFNEWARPLKNDYLAGGHKRGEQVNIGYHIWKTLSSEPLTDMQFKGLLDGDGSVRIYIVSWCGWKDEKGIRDSVFNCIWSQHLPKQGKDFVWQICAK